MPCIGTINKLDILMHYRVSTAPHPRLEAPAVQEGIKFLYDHEMIDRKDFPRVTTKGEVYLRHLLNTPFPTKIWVVEARMTSEAEA